MGLWLKQGDDIIPVSGGGGGGTFDGEHVLTGDPDDPPTDWEEGQLLWDGNTTAYDGDEIINEGGGHTHEALYLSLDGGMLQGSLGIEGELTARNTWTQDLTVDGTLNVSGETTVDSTLNVSGETTLDSTLNVSGETTLDSTLNVSGETTVGGKVVSVEGHTHGYSPTSHTHDEVGGLGLAGEGVPPSGAQIVRSGENGHTYLGWLNTVSGANTNTPTRIYTNNGGTDSFVRYMTPANFRKQVTDGSYSQTNHGHSDYSRTDHNHNNQYHQAHNGSSATAGFRFNSSTSSGMYYNTNYLGLTFQAAWKLLCYKDYVRTSVPINAPNGTKAKPAFTFQSDPDTGIWRPADNNIEIVTNGTRAAYFGAEYTAGQGVFMPGIRYNETTAYKANTTVMGVLTGGGLMHTTMTKRLMTATEPVASYAFERLFDLKPLFFRSLGKHDDKTKSHYGLAAEDVAEIDPRLATWGEDRDGNVVPENVDHDALIALLVASAKRQRDQIAELTARLDQIEA